ncbi:MAG: hypothetical protein AAF808_24375, partial [Cyanobacteria bacterium P01_D01_bin.2]
PIAFDYSGSAEITVGITDALVDIASPFIDLPSGSLGYEAVFSGSVPADGINFLDGSLTATVPELLDLYGITLTPDLEDTLDFALGLVGSPRPGFSFVSDGMGAVSSGGTVISSFDLFVDTASLDLVATLGVPTALSACLTEVCSAEATFSATINGVLGAGAPVELAFLTANVSVETVPQFDEPGDGEEPGNGEEPGDGDEPTGPGGGDPASVPEPAVILGLIGIGGWLIKTR